MLEIQISEPHKIITESKILTESTGSAEELIFILLNKLMLSQGAKIFTATETHRLASQINTIKH